MFNLSGVVTGALAGAAMLAAHYGQPALAHVLNDPTLASEVVTAVTALSAIGSVVAGALHGVIKKPS